MISASSLALSSMKWYVELRIMDKEEKTNPISFSLQTTEKQIKTKEQGTISQEVDNTEEIVYRIEIPANRYDLLCTEGLALALNIFLGRQEIPEYRQSIPNVPLQLLTVKPDVRFFSYSSKS